MSSRRSVIPIHASLYIRVYATKFRNFNEEEKKKVLEHDQTVERPRKGTIGNLGWVPYTFIAFQGIWRHFVGGSKLLGRAQTKCTVKPSGKRRKIDARW